MKRNILVLGSMNVDFVVNTHSQPLKGQTVLGTGFKIFPGGKGANQAVAAAKAGGSVAMAGIIGDDPFSSILTDSLEDAGVNTGLVKKVKGKMSGCAFIVVDATGNNSIVVVPGANDLWTTQNVDDVFKKSTGTEILLMQLEIPFDVVEFACEKAWGLGMAVILDPAPARVLSKNTRNYVYVVTPNQHEAYEMTGIEVSSVDGAKKAALELKKQGYQRVIVKIGELGSVCAENDYVEHIPAMQVSPKDTTAAGDAFAGGLGVALSRGESLVESCRFASIVAGLSVTREGAQSSMPDLSEINMLWRKNNVG